MEEPKAGIAGTKSQNYISVIWHGNGVLECRFGVTTLPHCDRWHVITAAWKPDRNWWPIRRRANLEHHIHADDNVKLEMTMEQPNTGIVSTKPQHCIAIIRHGNSVLQRWLEKATFQQATLIQLQCMLQIHTLQLHVRRTAHAQHDERGAMQMKWMTDIYLLHFIDQHNLHNSTKWYIDFVYALTILTAFGGTVVAIAKMLWWYFIVLREYCRWWWYIGDFIDQRYQVIGIRSDCNVNNGRRLVKLKLKRCRDVYERGNKVVRIKPVFPEDESKIS